MLTLTSPLFPYTAPIRSILGCPSPVRGLPMPAGTGDAIATTQPRLAVDRVKSSVLSQRIFIRDLTLSCSIGVSEEERARRQRLRINIELAVDYPPPSRDTITEVVDYGRLAKAVRNHVLSTTFRLLATLAEELSEV